MILSKYEIEERHKVKLTREKAIRSAQADITRFKERIEELTSTHRNLIAEGDAGPSDLYCLAELYRIKDELYHAEERLTARKRSRSRIFLGELTEREYDVFFFGLSNEDD